MKYRQQDPDGEAIMIIVWSARTRQLCEIGVDQRAPRNAATESGVIQFSRHGPQAGFDVAQVFAKRKLTKCQTQKLIATREAAMSPIASVTTHARIEFVPWKTIHELRENQFQRMHQLPFRQENEISEPDYRVLNSNRARSWINVNHCVTNSSN